MISRRSFASSLALVIVATPLVAEGEQARTVPRIGVLVGGSRLSDSARIEAFRQGLRELGYVEGKNIVVEYRYAEGKPQRLPELAAALVRLKVDIIVAAGPAATRAAKDAAATIPILMAQVNDPVGAGFVASLARPGTNITGLSTMTSEISGKQMQLLKEVISRLTRVAVLGSSAQPGNAQVLREAEHAAGTLGIQIQYLDALGPRDIETSFQIASKERADAILVLSSPLLFSHRKEIAALTMKSRLPSISSWPEFVEDGGLMSYSANINDLFRRVATYIDKIVKGVRPEDLPVEQPTTFEFMINLQVAKQISLTVPQSVLLRADKIIQ